jgi:hypothetical protein
LEVRSANSFEAELGVLAYPTKATSLLIPIEQVPLGARVPTKNPKPWEYDDSLPDPVQADWAKIAIKGQIKDRQFCVDQRLFLGYDSARWDD